MFYDLNMQVSNFRGSAWQYSEERGQYYLHQFAVGQPDLNYREPRLHDEIKVRLQQPYDVIIRVRQQEV